MPEKISPETKQLYQAILKLKNLNEAKAFFRDLLTPQEIDTFSVRFKIARLLYQGHSYSRVAKKLSVSTTTVTRVALWLKRGRGGYRRILNRLFK
jgi:TrpR-related protein YerC/YecD